MTEQQISHPVPGQDQEVLRCPNGCSFDEIETGKESQSFMAVMGAPFQHLRCGKCNFNGDSKTVELSNNLGDAITNWNKAIGLV